MKRWLWFLSLALLLPAASVPPPVPLATTLVFGQIKPDGTSCTTTAGVLTCSGGGGGTFPSGSTTNPVCQTGAANTGAACGVINTTADVGSAAYALTDGATISTNCASGNLFSVTLGGNRTLGNPTNCIAGHTYSWEVKQPASGGPYTLTYASDFIFFTPYSAASPPVLSTGASAVDAISCLALSSTSLACSFGKGAS